jgi:hypothetical protein
MPHYNRPHRGHFGASGLDRTHQLIFTPTADLPHGLRLSMIAHLASPLPLRAYIPQQDGGGVAGEIFRSDITGDGTVGDLLPGYIRKHGKILDQQVDPVDRVLLQHVRREVDAGGLCVGEQRSVHRAATGYARRCLSADLLEYPLRKPGLSGAPRALCGTWLKTIDLRLSWPFLVGERVKLEPNVALFNVFKFANFGGAGNQLSGVLNDAPGTRWITPARRDSAATQPLSALRARTGFWPVPAHMQMEFRGKWSSGCGSRSRRARRSRGKAASLLDGMAGQSAECVTERGLSAPKWLGP